jgi:hypothetical protein
VRRPTVAEPHDALVDFVEDECPTCGAYMLNPAIHRDWHEKQRRQFGQLDEAAHAYRPAPRYS